MNYQRLYEACQEAQVDLSSSSCESKVLALAVEVELSTRQTLLDRFDEDFDVLSDLAVSAILSMLGTDNMETKQANAIQHMANMIHLCRELVKQRVELELDEILEELNVIHQGQLRDEECDRAYEEFRDRDIDTDPAFAA